MTELYLASRKIDDESAKLAGDLQSVSLSGKKSEHGNRTVKTIIAPQSDLVCGMGRLPIRRPANPLS